VRRSAHIGSEEAAPAQIHPRFALTIRKIRSGLLAKWMRCALDLLHKPAFKRRLVRFYASLANPKTSGGNMKSGRSAAELKTRLAALTAGPRDYKTRDAKL
jgi:hypothetical protein